MKSEKTSVFKSGLIWFGAAVSIAEIMTGTYFAPLGLAKGLAAILLGHAVGCVLMFFAGLISAKSGRSAMDSTKMSFGSKGSILFSVVNVIQLAGWTGIMICDGACAAGSIVKIDRRIWCAVIGALILLWILLGIKDLGKVSTAAMVLLFVMALILSFSVFGKNGSAHAKGEISFGAAVELSAAMPLSWIPLIGDYTKDAKKGVLTSAVSAAVYGTVSCWMYAVGMGSALFTGKSEVSEIIASSLLGSAGLVIVVLSTVTTTFLDAFSAGLSTESIFPKAKGKVIAVATTVVGTVGAVLFPMDDISDFLYLIGSVFSPMAAILITDHFILKRDLSIRKISIVNFAVWAAGFASYRILMKFDLPLGSTVPAMFITAVLCAVCGFISKKRASKSKRKRG